MYDILIIGDGVTKACIVRELPKYDLDILVLKKNNDAADEKIPLLFTQDLMHGKILLWLS
ncbi:MAG: hypothetical protein LBV03_00490 [Fusobacteriales bacterium]|jgi:hypothetical protein|nr:hypothetical protein [Fusobacteriales bacterium]